MGIGQLGMLPIISNAPPYIVDALSDQITVKNIHIRYEDELSLDNRGVGVDGGVNVPRPLSVGVTLRELVMQTVDENWTPTNVQGEAGTGKGGNRLALTTS